MDVDTIDDADKFSETCRCMESIGLGPEAQEDVFRVRIAFEMISRVVVAGYPNLGVLVFAGCCNVCGLTFSRS